jgi:hypothetical protein
MFFRGKSLCSLPLLAHQTKSINYFAKKEDVMIEWNKDADKMYVLYCLQLNQD